MDNKIPAPNFTMIPNILFDYWMDKLTPAEFKVLLCICRKTFGWKKVRDHISLRQIEKMTGLGRSSIIKNVEKLIELNLVLKIKSKDKFDGSDAPNQYEINVSEIATEEEGGEKNRGGSALRIPPLVHSEYSPLVHSEYPQKKDITKETIQKKESPIPPSSEPSDHAIGLATLLFEKLKELNPKHKLPNIHSWALHIDRMLRIDKRTPEEIKQIIEWLPTDAFWMKNIQSTEKLRDKFDTLWITMAKPSKKVLEKTEDSTKANILRKNQATALAVKKKYSSKLQDRQIITVTEHTLNLSDSQRKIYANIPYNENGFEDQVKNVLRLMEIL